MKNSNCIYHSLVMMKKNMPVITLEAFIGRALPQEPAKQAQLPVRVYYGNGQLCSEAWYVDGKLHRIDGPASTGFYVTGQPYYEFWYANGLLHRADGPAVRRFRTGQSYCEEWWIEGNLQKISVKETL